MTSEYCQHWVAQISPNQRRSLFIQHRKRKIVTIDGVVSQTTLKLDIFCRITQLISFIPLITRRQTSGYTIEDTL